MRYDAIIRAPIECTTEQMHGVSMDHSDFTVRGLKLPLMLWPPGLEPVKVQVNLRA